MSAIASLLDGVALIATPFTLLLIVIGVTVGLALGATPGIGPVPGIALALPLTLGLQTWEALSLLFAIYVGGMYGGAVSAILLNVPGTAGAIASTFDGYPFSLRGEAGYAIQISVLASSLGTIFAALLLILSVPILITVIALFGTPEYALVAIFGLTIIPLISQHSMGKSLLMAGFGLMISAIGMPPMSSEARYTFGLLELSDGVEFVAVLLGIFAIAEMLKLTAYEGSLADSQPGGSNSATGSGAVESAETAHKPLSPSVELADRFVDIFIRNPMTFIKSVLVAIVIGFIPAAGGAVSNILAYALEKGTAKNSDSFGTGDVRGVIAAESANSGTIASSLVPLLAFAIPGSPTAAVILGGMLMHGLNPGPGLFGDSVHMSYATFVSIALGGLALLFIGLLTATQIARVANIEMTTLVPAVIILCVTGTYALSLSFIDVVMLVSFGLIGYLMIKYNYSTVAFILGLILGPVIEENVHRAFQLGDATIFVGAPLRILLVVLIVGSLIVPIASAAYRQYGNRRS